MAKTATKRKANGQWAKGSTGNPGGYSKTRREARATFCDAIKDKDMRAIAEKLTEMAIDGNLNAIELVLAYKIGKPVQSLALEEPTSNVLVGILDRLWPDESTAETAGET